MDKFQKEKIRNLRREGMSYAKIAKQVDVSRDAVICPFPSAILVCAGTAGWGQTSETAT